ncbi:MAG: PilZ domain-containing protein [Symbiobacteriaceae bacterium]|nr:PilZ domain-containing protein [Symbiobacteriaceae bacterium]
MSEQVFRRGKEVRISWLDQDNPEVVYSLTASVLTKDINSLYVTSPRNARELPITRHTEIAVFVVNDANDVEEYSTIFEGVEDELSLFPMWALRYPLMRVSVKRINKRGHFRLDLRVPFSFCRIKEEKWIPIDYPYLGETINISGGGMRGVVPFRLDSGEQLEVMLCLEPYRLILRSEVVMQKPVRIPGKYSDEVALRFISHVGEDHEEFLVRYVTREQINRTALV